MNERKRPARRGRTGRPGLGDRDLNPYADVPDPASPAHAPPPPPPAPVESSLRPVADFGAVLDRLSERPTRKAPDPGFDARQPRAPRPSARSIERASPHSSSPAS